ncbi:hypothetical protein ATSB10_34530 [Dyella thiooxydans]|uniref:Uncharacterized protein n=1 Tax=Dyella thiooxydans TaxID=445710 RepID=A0A160N4S7_9GAMM|nr:hypothetical protein ATSB10_34530 [Dyella thiooxydans]
MDRARDFQPGRATARAGPGCLSRHAALRRRRRAEKRKKFFTSRALGSTVSIRSQPQHLVCASWGFTPKLVW